MSGKALRVVFFLVVMTLVVGWVSANDEYAALARSFLRQLFRQVF